MTKSSKTASTSTPAFIPKTPTHIAYHIKGSGEDAFWTRIGSAWQHTDGKGFNLRIYVVPPDGRITLRVRSEEK